MDALTVALFGFLLGSTALTATAPTARSTFQTPRPSSALDQTSSEWTPVWEHLALLETLERSTPRFEQLAAELEQRVQAGPAGFRARLLAAHLARLCGESSRVEDPQADPELSLTEAVLAARVLDAGAMRWPFEVFRNATSSGRLAAALPLARAMHTRAEAPWSAASLALLLRRLGSYDEARSVLEQQRARTEQPEVRTQLALDLGLLALGAGHEERARAHLGTAYARGSSGAAEVLGWLALRAGERARARRVFGALLVRPDPGPWALRGWGIALLPAR